MQVTLEIPDQVARLLGSDQQGIGRKLLERATVEGYRCGEFSRAQMGEALGLGWHEVEELLARHGCHRDYGREDLEEDLRNLDELLGPA